MKQGTKSIIMMIIASVLTAFGQLCWKLAGTQGIWLLIMGFSLYGLGAVVMMIAFKWGELSVLYPIMCVGYVIAIINGKVFLNEQVGSTQIVGIIIIMVGVIFMGLGGKE